MTQAPLLLTMGDAVGIGPEIVWRAFVQGQADACVVVGDASVLRRAAQLLLPHGLPLALIDDPVSYTHLTLPTSDLV